MFDLVLQLKGKYETHIIIAGGWLPLCDVGRVRDLSTNGEYLTVQFWDYTFSKKADGFVWVYDLTDGKLLFGELPCELKKSP